MPRPPPSTLFPYTTLFRSSAVFKDASGVVPQDEVRIAGVKVGSVLSVSPGADGNTKVAMMLEPRYLGVAVRPGGHRRSEEHTSELQSQSNIVCRLLLEKKK